mmetsp:Transcript_8006/g.11429  ORF Transcript_8006/g.11429 Transcript_8006/m.11429 type:complete len:184 (-) Transcript_8006:248-799(-)
MTVLKDSLMKFLQALYTMLEGEEKVGPHSGRQFEPTKTLSEKDFLLIDMLNSLGHDDVCFCIADPSLKDMELVFASDGFCKFTGYPHNQIEGKNCRFLQGADTKKEDVDRIRVAIKEEKDVCVNLLNYKKDGSSFINEFFLSPLRGQNGEVLYFIGVQCAVDKLGPGQMNKNKGWVYTQGSHI